jgi:hypothetical protein
MKEYGEVQVKILAFLTSAVDVDEWLASRSRRFINEEKTAGIHWIGGWVNPRTALDSVERKLFSLAGSEAWYHDYAA